METRHSSLNKGRMEMEIDMELDLIGDHHMEMNREEKHQKLHLPCLLNAKGERKCSTTSCRLWSYACGL